MKTEILTLLRETDGYVSGQELCEKIWCLTDGSLESN